MSALEELPDSTFLDRLLWLLRRRQRFRVTGYSMLPLLKPGDEILVNCKAYRTALPRVGDLVVAQHPHRSGLKVVKRVMAVGENGACFLMGDNPQASTDSRAFGAVPRQMILGRVVSRF